VQEIVSLVCYFDMLHGKQMDCFPPVSATFDFSADFSLQPFQSFLSFFDISGIVNSLPVGDCCKMLKSDIDADLFFGLRLNWFTIDFAGKDSEPLTGFVHFDGHGLGFSFGHPVQDDGDVSYFRNMQPFLGDESKARLRVGDTVNTRFEPWETFLFARRVFCPSEKAPECFMNSVRDVLFHLRMKVSVFSCEMFIVVVASQCFTRSFVGINGQFKKFIVDCFANHERIKKKSLLFFGRVQSVLIHSQFHTYDILLRNYLILHIHPTSKEVGFLLRNFINFVHKNHAHNK